jgi:hypothetical protein
VWSFWRDWYQGFLDGKPLDWELQHRVALIPDQDWEQGPEHIAVKIEEIRARYALEQRIAELEEELVVTSASRMGIGGNNPPEPIEPSVPIARELTLIWSPLQELKSELEAESAEPTRVRKAIQALGQARAKGLAWAASKADLAVDTLIKWGIPAAGGYLVLNPEKMAAVIDAAKTWLSLLP